MDASASGTNRLWERCRGRGAVRTALLSGVIVAWPWSVGPACAERPPDEKFDLTFERPGDPDTWIRPNVRWDTAWFAGFGAWGGNAEENIGDETNGWMELGVVPAIDGQVSLGGNGTLSGRLSGVFTTTQIGLDWGGSNFIDGETRSEMEFTLEDFYLRWTSGEVVPGLGKDAIDLSVGAQSYQVGPGDLGAGFIFYKAGSDGGRRGGYWLGLRHAFELTAIARLETGEFQGEAVVLRSNDLGGDHTHVAGASLGYDFGKLLGLNLLRLGFGYWNVFDSDDERRDGLHVINVRVDAKPSPPLSGLRLTGEMVKEKNGSRNDSWGAWGELGYDLGAHDCPWAPYVSYRYAYFSGDDQEGDDNAFDPLFYGFSDWNYWYIGEISGEWVTGNSNFQASILRLRVNPLEALTAQLFWIYQRLGEFQNAVVPPGGRPVDPRVAAITDKDLSHEVDLIFDWSVNQYLSASFVSAFLVPLEGGRQFFGNDEPWGQFMIYTRVKF